MRPLPSPVSQEIIDLADRSLDIGYKVLAKRVQKVSAFHQGTMMLKGIGVDVYDPKSVEWYQRVAVLKAKYLIHISNLIYTAILFPLAYVFARMVPMFKHPSAPEVFFGVLALILGCLGVVSLIAYIVKTASNQYLWEWNKISLESYDKPIPEEVLRTALKIKDEWPKAELVVEELRTRKRVIDPFLYVIYKDVRLYVSVWNEPKFSAQV